MIISGLIRPLLNQALVLDAAGAVLKIGQSLKRNHHYQIQPD
jgi:hypothetical protein